MKLRLTVSVVPRHRAFYDTALVIVKTGDFHYRMSQIFSSGMTAESREKNGLHFSGDLCNDIFNEVDFYNVWTGQNFYGNF